MKKINKIIPFILLIILGTNISYAADLSGIQKVNNITIDNSEQLQDITSTEIIQVGLNREDIFNYYGAYFDEVPLSYKYIKLNYKLIRSNSNIEKSLKKLVYLNKIDNVNKNLYLHKDMDAYVFFSLAKKILDLDIILDKEELSKRKTGVEDLNAVKEIYNYYKKIDEDKKSASNTLGDKRFIFDDVYETIIGTHYDHENIDKNDLIYGAIEGLARGTNDIHTVFFPPVESKNFDDNLAGEYEGIGSYVEMSSPGELKITSPIPGGPAEKSGLKGGDIVTSVNGKKVTKDNSLSEVVSWIKGPAGSIVELIINRAGNELKFEVKREKIIVKNLEYSKTTLDTYNIQIKSFGAGVAKEFKSVLEKINDDTGIRKIIIDLRNNGGGYLNEVTDMLGYVITEGEQTAVVKYNGSNNIFYSAGLDIIDLNKYKVIILQNSGTASASEIMIGSLKDYFPNIKTIGENTYGKGSVQTMKEYEDGSSLKYTIAKWFTGKTETGIDGVGFKPDIELELDIDMLNNNNIDNQLEKAIIQ